MIIPIEVTYTKKGKKGKKQRNVVGIICPSVICQLIRSNVKPIYVNMGDILVDWNLTSPAFKMLLEVRNEV